MVPASANQELWLAASPPHAREPWPQAGCAEVLIHGHYEVMKGVREGSRLPKEKMATLYKSAKNANDLDAAHEVVEALWNPVIFEELFKRVRQAGVRPIVISPHPSFDDEDCIDHDTAARISPRNGIPFAYGARLRAMLNGLPNQAIVQAARVGRTKLPRFPRFLFQPHFVGDVATDRPYIIAEDTVTLGGTLAALISHIVRHNGTVIAVTALCNKAGKSDQLALTSETYNALCARFGHELNAFWKENVGHEVACLTEGEGRFLLEWSPAQPAGNPSDALQQLRTRIDRARAKFE